jgi:hypothetical protein
VNKRQLRRLINLEIKRRKKYFGLQGWKITWEIVDELPPERWQDKPDEAYAVTSWWTAVKQARINFLRSRLTSAKAVRRRVFHELCHIQVALLMAELKWRPPRKARRAADDAIEITIAAIEDAIFGREPSQNP